MNSANQGGKGMDWLIAGVLLVLMVTVLVRLKKAERRRP
jgi:hypothetical protein